MSKFQEWVAAAGVRAAVVEAMPRKPILTTSTFPYHISARTVNREAFASDLDPVWSLMSDYLYLVAKAFDLSIHSFVLMPNHFHLLVSSPPGNLSPSLNHFMRETSRGITQITGRINQTYGCRNHKTVIGSYQYFLNAYKYVYRNPVRAGLCERVEDYKFSTLSGLLGFRQIVIPLAEDMILFPERFDDTALDWLNSKPDADHEEEVRCALRKPTFVLAKRNGRPSVLERSVL
ncbi:hypothetical protein BH10BDE1_BH10BDE1_36270 [soil metagenome]